MRGEEVNETVERTWIRELEKTELETGKTEDEVSFASMWAYTLRPHKDIK